MPAATAEWSRLLPEFAAHPLELDILARRGGTGVVRLRPEWNAILRSFGSLGRVRSLTGSRVAVIEHDGRFGSAEEAGSAIRFTDGDLEMTAELEQWACGFAVARPGREPGHVCRSLRFYRPDGAPAHQVRLRKESALAGFEGLVEEFVDQQAGEVPLTGPPAGLASGETLETVGGVLARAAAAEGPVQFEIGNGACRQRVRGRIHKVSEGDDEVIALAHEFRVRIRAREVHRMVAGEGGVALLDGDGRVALRLTAETAGEEWLREAALAAAV